MQVVGLCRFSYPANINAFQTRHKDMAERKAALYAPDRLAARTFLFENVLLPGVRAQTDPDFTLLLLMGEDIPEPWRSRIVGAISDVPLIKPVFRPAGLVHRDLYRDLFLAERDAAAGLVAEFRIDDDDALAHDFVERLRKAEPLLASLVNDHGRAAIDFQKGLLMDMRQGRIDYRPVVVPGWAPALAMIQRAGAGKCVMDIMHHKMWLHMPTLTFQDSPMFLRGSHETNDSQIKLGGAGDFNLPAEALPALLRDRFCLDMAENTRRWAELTARQATRR
jgi:hypothetical protein